MNRNRIVALLLALVLCTGLLPISAAAAEPVAHPVEGGYLYFDTETGAITGLDYEVRELVIPETIGGVAVTSIAAYALEHRTSLYALTLPKTLTDIGDYAFRYCNKSYCDCSYFMLFHIFYGMFIGV